jgi:hypothetical protein
MTSTPQHRDGSVDDISATASSGDDMSIDVRVASYLPLSGLEIIAAVPLLGSDNPV